MTRSELITSIEAGETGRDVDALIAKEIGLYPIRDGGELLYVEKAPGSIRQTTHEVPHYTTSIDAAVTLLAGCGWYVTEHGRAVVWRGPIGRRHEARIPNKPAAALVAAWLKATA